LKDSVLEPSEPPGWNPPAKERFSGTVNALVDIPDAEKKANVFLFKLNEEYLLLLAYPNRNS